MRVGQGDGLFRFGVNPKESEKVLVRQFVEHEYVTRDALDRLRGNQLVEPGRVLGAAVYVETSNFSGFHSIPSVDGPAM